MAIRRKTNCDAMTDAVFVVEEDRLLAKRPTAIRETQLRKLELRALLEECGENDKRVVREVAPGSDEFRFFGMGNR